MTSDYKQIRYEMKINFDISIMNMLIIIKLFAAQLIVIFYIPSELLSEDAT